MVETDGHAGEVVQAYRRRARRYDRTLAWFSLFDWLGFSIEGWRHQAVRALNLKPGNTVVDIGCGTGRNFPLLQEIMGPDGSVIGLDLSDAMLEQARQQVARKGWENVRLVCADASEFVFPSRVDAVLSTYTLTLVPEPGRVIARARRALAPGGRLVILDMAWPRFCPLWWRHVLFFLRSYGVTADVLKRHPWDAVQKAMAEGLSDVVTRPFWFGFFYLSSGTVAHLADPRAGTSTAIV